MVGPSAIYSHPNSFFAGVGMIAHAPAMTDGGEDLHASAPGQVDSPRRKDRVRR